MAEAQAVEKFDCVVIGGGAAGLMCAATAGQRGRRVLVLEHTKKVGKKILMSGGGRCNFTNYEVEPRHYRSENAHFCISALRRFTPDDFLELVHKYQLPYHEKTLGQLFCDHKSRDILNLLLAECELGQVEIRTNSPVHKVEPLPAGVQARFRLTLDAGLVDCESLVVATGGLSIPTMGATGFGYDLAKQFALKVTPRQAALVPFTLKGRWLRVAQELAGVSAPVRVSCQGQSFVEAMLFTHKGLSGPAMLQISNYWSPGEAIEVDFLPGESLRYLLDEWRSSGAKAGLKTLLSRYLPGRFVAAWLDAHPELSALADKPVAQYRNTELDALVLCFQHWRCVPNGTEGYRTAEVTRGGVNTDGVSSKTFEAKSVPGLYFVGEVLDVTGWLGGYNFQWAWASGYCAGQYV
ncbi:NAD(P)/FAD-dependent oxidoreductase [Marinimicrobium sp. ABcell2]|uniref:NAD(P)/FAD-dependent oxidoreductase n=1 Tax=Marinimicrobium sp. ABcell2 TaxID=3069751 RepID=UPI00359C970D